MEKKKITKTQKEKPVKSVKTSPKPAAKTPAKSANGMLAVLTLGGSQYLVSEGAKLQVDLLAGKEGSTEKVPALILDPKIAKGSITYKILEHQRGPKIRVATYKAKSRYRRVKGSRSHLSEIKVEKIMEGGK